MTALARLLEQATPGPWVARIGKRDDPGKDWHGEEYTQGIDLGSDDYVETDGGHYGPQPANARLIALAPDMARLLVDAMAMLRLPVDEIDEGDCADIFARFAELEQRAAP